MPRFTATDLPDRMSQADLDAPNRYTEEALARHKREGLDLAIRARWIALAVIAVMLPFLNPTWSVLYFHALLVLLAINGWAMRRVGRVGRSGAELALIFVDLLLMTIALAAPNPFAPQDWPTAMTFEFGSFIYFFVILAGGTLAYSWRTILAIGNWTAVLWLGAAGLVWYFGRTIPELSAAANIAFGDDPELLKLLDPNNVDFDIRLQEVVVFLITAFTLALTVRRFNRLLLGNAALERERANLSRYFSPNVVDQLSRNDEPLKQIQTHDVAVLFVDMVGFTSYAARHAPEEVIGTLRAFHRRMEAEVFRHNGTLDKYMGDGLMATFGTPVATDRDAANALACARAMIDSLAEWNAERAAGGEPAIRAGFGLHFGPVVLGDIGANRLEFAVIGNTVNVASRLEGMTRQIGATLAVSDSLRAEILGRSGSDAGLISGLVPRGAQIIRGLDHPVEVWSL
ncbi:MAG: adenylate/guanylate cyclase domain-containing protein [Rhodobacteraceae bacterium]|nr:MAG: adenylate/guanylate cyclase domain-containing protein [Paracoccaceae bacterium]